MKSSMDEAQVKRAARVCKVCAQRKKTCDKGLPSCGFCLSRSLQCAYDEPTPSGQRTRNYNPGRHFVAVEDVEAASLSTPPLVESIKQQVSYLLRLINLSHEQVEEKYFRLSYQWPPIISPRSVSTALSDAADSSVLHLAMGLLVAFSDLPKTGAKVQSPTNRSHFYTSTKSVFGQAQACISASKPLLQAGLLIATCEYVSGNPNTAYITLATCVAMMQVLGPRSVEPLSGGGGLISTGTNDETCDWLNIKWSMGMIERIILCEMPQKDISLLTKYPITIYRQNLHQHTSSERQSQAIIFLNQVLAAKSLMTENRDHALAELRNLDTRIRDFLAILVEEKATSTKPHSPAALPLAIRVLFLLHHLIISNVQMLPQSTASDRTILELSKAALDMVSRMAIDLARYRTEQGSVPICCYYNLVDAMGWLQNDSFDSGNSPPPTDIQLLSQLIEQYQEAWMMS